MTKKKKILIIVLILLCVLIILFTLQKTGVLKNIRDYFKKEEIKEFTYKTYMVSGNKGTALIVWQNEKGIKSITYEENEKTMKVNFKGKTKAAIDYEMEDLKTYNFIAEFEDGEQKTYTIDFEIPRIKGEYTLINGTYVNKPDVSTGFVKNKTRYMYLNENGTLSPGNWITDEEPQNWYDYSNQKWANIYVEDNGIEAYYVWIPRYMYKVDTANSTSGNERMDVKFINTYNEYIDGTTGEKMTYEQLVSEGYKLPEAFSWEQGDELYSYDVILPGYWMSKYQLSELGSNYTIDYILNASATSFNVKNIETNTDKQIAKYTYAINGKIMNESLAPEDYQFTEVNEESNTVNVTALDENGSIIGSMTKEIEPVEVNKPNLTGFDQDTTFYVYWDENGIEHNEIPISQPAPENWYNYTYSQWANIVTRNNGQEAYLVWIPRYEYSLDQTSRKSRVKFIVGTGTETTNGYKIPEAFTWGDNKEVELTGYWMSKYQLSIEEANARVDAEMAAMGNGIRIKNITGTLIEQAQENSVSLKYEYYLNGELKHTGNSNLENYMYENLELNKTYTVNIIIRETQTNKYVGAITKKVKTENANSPELLGFVESRTYYVLYDEEGNETIGENIKNDGSNIPENWYDYSNSKWANIVITDGTIENGKIINATATTYLTWIPRYEYRILTDRDNLDVQNRRTEVNFLPGTSVSVTDGYKIPEAFTWGDNKEVELTGYWMSKYQLSD